MEHTVRVVAVGNPEFALDPMSSLPIYDGDGGVCMATTAIEQNRTAMNAMGRGLDASAQNNPGGRVVSVTVPGIEQNMDGSTVARQVDEERCGIGKDMRPNNSATGWCTDDSGGVHWQMARLPNKSRTSLRREPSNMSVSSGVGHDGYLSGNGVDQLQGRVSGNFAFDAKRLSCVDSMVGSGSSKHGDTVRMDVLPIRSGNAGRIDDVGRVQEECSHVGSVEATLSVMGIVQAIASGPDIGVDLNGDTAESKGKSAPHCASGRRGKTVDFSLNM